MLIILLDLKDEIDPAAHLQKKSFSVGSVLYENVHLDCLCWWLPSRCKNHSFWPLLHLSVMRKCLNQIENIIEPKIFNNRLCERTQYSKSHPLWGKLNEPLNTTIGCHMAIKFFINPFYNIDFWTFVWMNSFFYSGRPLKWWMTFVPIIRTSKYFWLLQWIWDQTKVTYPWCTATCSH